jgi:hypothetical protein
LTISGGSSNFSDNAVLVVVEVDVAVVVQPDIPPVLGLVADQPIVVWNPDLYINIK